MLAVLTAALVLAAPPPAFASVNGHEQKLGQGSYCWRSLCADYIAPRCGDGRTPTIRARRGDVIRFRLGFTAKEAAVSFLGAARPIELKPAKLRLTVARRGVFLLFTRPRGPGDASYAGCIRLTG